MTQRPLYRYSDGEMRTIRERIRQRDHTWLHAVWDPILLEFEGMAYQQAADEGLKFDVRDYGIPWEQFTTVSSWLANVRGGFRLAWFCYGPSPVKPQDREQTDE